MVFAMIFLVIFSDDFPGRVIPLDAANIARDQA